MKRAIDRTNADMEKPGKPNRLTLALRGGLFFLLTGPFFGAVLMTLFLCTSWGKVDGPLFILDTLGIMMLGGYILGSAPAFLTGMIAGALTPLLGKWHIRFFIAMIAALISAFFAVKLTIGKGYWMATAPTGFLATLICIALYHRLIAEKR